MRLNDGMWSIWTPNHFHLLADGDGDGGGGDAGEAGGTEGDGDGAAAGGGAGAEDGGGDAGTQAGQAEAQDGQGGQQAADLSQVLNSAEWVKFVPQEHLATATKYQTFGDFMKAHGELNSKIGQALFVPGKDATEEDWGKFYGKLGRPNTADGYKAPEIDGITFEGDQARMFFDTAHKLGLNQAQAEGLMRMQGEFVLAQQQQARQAMQRAHQKLIQEWGDDAEANYEKARRAALLIYNNNELKALGMADAEKHEAAKTWDPTIVQALARNSVMFDESRHIGRAERDAGKTDADLRDELEEITAKSDYWTSDKLQRRAQEISEMLSGNQSIHPAAQAG